MSRIFAVALFCTCILYLFSNYDLGLGDSPFPSFRSKPKDDILRFVDPLIGTTNGGKSFALISPHVTPSYPTPSPKTNKQTGTRP
jgi:hypothetical protein